MAWASFARLLRPGTSSVWCGALPCALGFGLILALATASAAADRTGVQRETEETRAVAAEVFKAVRRVQAENLTLQRTLPIEVRNLTVEDVTAAVHAPRPAGCRYRTPALHDPGQSDRPAPGNAEFAR